MQIGFFPSNNDPANLIISIIDDEGVETCIGINGECMPEILKACNEVYNNYTKKNGRAHLIYGAENNEPKTKKTKAKAPKQDNTPSLF